MAGRLIRSGEVRPVHADKRNASVVVALIAALTCGSVLLLWLEARLVPRKRNWEGSTLLMAQGAQRVAEVEIAYAERVQDVPPHAIEQAESLCLVFADGSAAWDGNGARVRLFVIGSGVDDELSEVQQHALLGVLGTLSRMSGTSGLAVELAAGSDAARTPGLPKSAAALRKLLERKGFIERVER